MTWDAFLGGLIAGVAAILLWEATARALRWRRRRKRFGHLEGRYRVSRKLTGQEERGMVVIAVQGTVLRIHFEDLDEDEAIVGAIEMNEHLPSSGRGHYSHDEGTKRMWGFWDIQLYDEDTILVHTTYSHYRDHFAVVSGFVWKRFSAPSVAAGPPVQAPSRAD